MIRGLKPPLALVMIQPEPVPGSYRHTDKSIREIVDVTIRETEMIADNGFDGFILQNRNDAPIRQIVTPEIVAYMTVIGYELKRRFPELVMGILINWDGLASLAVADAIEADFVRVEHLYTGVEVTYAGLLEAQCVDICNLRKRIKSKVPIYADVQEIHGVQLGGKPIPDAAWDTIENAFADGLFLAGHNPRESIELIQQVRKRVGRVPIFLGGGATGENACELLQHYDGVSVGSWVKNGNMKNPIDPDRAKVFMDEVRRARALRLER